MTNQVSHLKRDPNHLTSKQAEFVKRYVKGDLTMEQCAVKAGYAKASASTQASDNLKKPNIIKAIEKAQRASRSKEIWNRREKLKLLQLVMSKAINSVKKGKLSDATLFINSVKIHNEMTGDNAPEKHVIEIKDMTKDEIEHALTIIEG